VLAQAIIALGHNLQLQVVAEGVETAAQANFLADAGCDEAQGYIYGAAVDPSAYAERISKEKTVPKRRLEVTMLPKHRYRSLKLAVGKGTSA
jgi:sensor c-di-GMP phosphodiesterase-like protein